MLLEVQTLKADWFCISPWCPLVVYSDLFFSLPQQVITNREEKKTSERAGGGGWRQVMAYGGAHLLWWRREGGGGAGEPCVLRWLGEGTQEARSHFSGCPVIPARQPDTWARFLACVVFWEGGR